MDLLDKMTLLEANSVTAEDYERITGVTLDEHMKRMKEFVAEVKARTVRKPQMDVADSEQAYIFPMIERMSIPMAAGCKKREATNEKVNKEDKK